MQPSPTTPHTNIINAPFHAWPPTLTQLVLSEKFAWTKINYTHNNPVVAGLVKEPQDWIYSSASNCCDEESILEEVYCIVPMLTPF
jgi:hypothetical protein